MADKNVTLLPEKTTNVTNDEKIIIISGGVVKIVLASLFKGDPGESIQGLPGAPGSNGKSAYELWLQAGGTGTVNTFLESLIGDDGESAYELWLSAGNSGSLGEFLASLNGTDGKSAYQLWKQEGNTGTVSDFLESLKGDDGVGTPGRDGATFDYRGDYDPGASYDVGFVVLFNGSGYVSLIDGNTTNPETTGNWGKIASKGLDGEGGDMYASNNLSEVDATLARVNLNVYSKAEVDNAIANVTVDAYTKAQSDAKYELKFTKNTAFNVNFGVITGTVLEGSNDALYEKLSRKGQPNGYVGLDSNSLIPTINLPSFVDDVIDVDLFANLPATGEAGKIYVVYEDSVSNNGNYRWGGTQYSKISSTSDAVWGHLTGTLTDQADLQSALASKSGIFTTLSGYGITDAYTKTEADAKYAILNIANTFTQNQALQGDNKYFLFKKGDGAEVGAFGYSTIDDSFNLNMKYLGVTTNQIKANGFSYINGGNVGIGTTNPASIAHLYQNNTEIGSGAGITIEQGGTGDAVLQILRSGSVRWKVGSPSDGSFAISNGPLTSPLLLLKSSGELQTRRLAYRHSNGTPRYAFDQFGSNGVSDRMYISMYNSSGDWLGNPIEIDNFDSGTRQIRFGYQVKLSTTNTPTSPTGLPAGTIWKDGNGFLKMA